MRLCIGTGWHSNGVGPRNSIAPEQMYRPDYIESVWKPYIERFVKPIKYVVYQSECVAPAEIVSDDIQVIKSSRSGTMHHNNDYVASYMAGAMYAFINECHFVYIEQDCLVYGLDKAIEWALKKPIVYGYGQYSPVHGWPETSFTFINWKYLSEFMEHGTQDDWAFWTHEHDKPPFGEMRWRELYQCDAAFWPFGYGRSRPIDFTQDIFYAQHITENEMQRFFEK